MSQSNDEESLSSGDRIRNVGFLTVCRLLGGGCIGSAVQAQETQVPIDEDSTVYTVNRELWDEWGLFPDGAGFQEVLR